ncbi:hypothetical protein K432DRAFT_387656 [Lepidopterella palustris CBS 459.81]|uniref:Uncharacterized protein n=1 Tax=Lepidopterella palustris CBS 459.81 TaxID=1314670 RepID=A0A8E2J844_9PEZI|nr:hypothetical protein K432DRAFT_387656 [Lepidopterella palustris CBS 459.81]
MSGTVHRCYLGAKCSSRLLKATSAISTCNPAYASKNPFSRKKTLAYPFSMSSSASQAPGGPWEPKSDVDYQKIPRLPLPADPMGTIRACIHDHMNKKWGFLIYRCDYSSDDAWAKFISTVQLQMREGLELLRATDLVPTLEMTVKEDRETLDGASVDQVREIFKSWVQGNEAKEELRDAPYPGPFQYVRYTYCVHVDADALDSIVNRAPQLPKRDYKRIGYVNLVQLCARDMIPYSDPSDVDPEEEEHDEDEGDENFVKVPLDCLDPERYAQLFNAATFDRMRRYRRKEDGVSLAG